MSKVTIRRFRFAFLFFVAVVTSATASAQTVQINPDAPVGPTILRAGWDIKAWANRLDTENEARGLYVNVDANFLRVPFSPMAHEADGTVDTTQYDIQLNAIRSVLAVRPEVEIYASVRLGGVNTFPDWVSQPTAAWPLETGDFFNNPNNRANQANPEHYSTMIRDYLSYMRDEGISIDFLGLNNETDVLVPVDRYIATYDLLQTKLDAAGIVGEFRDFKYVGPDTFSLTSGKNFVAGLANVGRLDTIDFVASHYYPQFGSGNESDWQDLSQLSGGKPLFHTEMHMPDSSAAIDDLSQTVRDSLSVQFASFRNGVDSYIWWDSGNNTNQVRDVVKREVMTTTLGAAPVFTTPTYQGKGDSDGVPLFQAFVEGSQVTLWIVNPGGSINNLPVNMLSQQVGSCLDGRYYLAPNGDNELLRSDIEPLSFNLNANGQGFTIDQIPSQSIAIVAFDMDTPANTNPITEVVFSNDFEDGNLTAETGSMTLVTDTSTPSIVPVTGGSDATLGSNVLLLDRGPNVFDQDLELALDVTLNLTDTLSLTDDNTVSLDFDVASRRTDGISKTVFVDAMGSNGKIVVRLVLGDSGVFGNGGSDRQRPGYANGAVGNFSFGTPPGSFWWGSDATPNGFDTTKDAHMSLTIGESCFELSTTKQSGLSYSSGDLRNFAGSSADIAEIKITSFGANHGMYFDNLRVAGVIADGPVVLLGDVNLDGVVNFSDIPAFISVLSGGEFQAEADCNEDGVVDFSDIPAFIDILINS